MVSDGNELIVFHSEDGKTTVDVHLQAETVWLSQAQMQELFDRDQSVISRHVNNVFKEGELEKESNMQKMHTANSDKPVAFYNLNVIISVGYRVKSQRGTQFRIWATRVLKEHLVKGFTVNRKRLAEKGVEEARQVLSLLASTLENHNLVNDEGRSVLEIVNRYADTWRLLLQYDEDSLPMPKEGEITGVFLETDPVRNAIASLKRELLEREEATDLFGNERNDQLEGIIGSIYQTFGGRDLYSSREEKAANLFYFIVKDHPFTDGNKRIGSFLFIMFLHLNGMLEKACFDNKALVALTLLTAASDPAQKDVLIRLIVNLLIDNSFG